MLRRQSGSTASWSSWDRPAHQGADVTERLVQRVGLVHGRVEQLGPQGVEDRVTQLVPDDLGSGL
jgi:hypothetical protein